MTIHKSLRVRNQLQRSRNVLNRWERIVALQAKGRIDPEKDGVLGLPKTRVAAKKK